VGDDADDDLDCHKPDDQDECDREVALVRIGADAVRMCPRGVVVMMMVVVAAMVVAAAPGVRVVAQRGTSAS
jgi:hypothetical protein